MPYIQHLAQKKSSSFLFVKKNHPFYCIFFFRLLQHIKRLCSDKVVPNSKRLKSITHYNTKFIVCNLCTHVRTPFYNLLTFSKNAIITTTNNSSNNNVKEPKSFSIIHPKKLFVNNPISYLSKWKKKVLTVIFKYQTYRH